MSAYNYLEAVKADLVEVLREDEYKPRADENFEAYVERVARKLEGDNDNITGMESGSYTCNTAEARGYIFSNMTLCLSALFYFDEESYSVVDLYNNAEQIDCYIRYYVLFNEINLEEIVKKFYKNS